MSSFLRSNKSNESSKLKRKINVYDCIIYLFCAGAFIVTACPFLHVFSMSISEPSEAARGTVWLLPRGFSLDVYLKIFRNGSLWRSFANSVFYTASGTLLSTTISAMGAYSMSKKRLAGKKIFVYYMLITMYISGGLIPSYVLINKIHLYNTIWVMIIPGMVSIWSIILVRTYFVSTIPQSLNESATIDGANDLHILFRIYLPLAKPIMAVISLYTAVGIWNSWYNALLYLPNKKLQPLQMFLANVLIFASADLKQLSAQEVVAASEGMDSALQLKYAAIMFTSIPIICVYPFLQKYFVKGALIGSLKE